MRLETVDRSLFGVELDACAQFLRDSFKDPSITVEWFESVRANAALIHVLYRQIGSSGLLYERATKRIVDIPGAVGADVYVWAYDRGALLEDDNVLVIDEVRDRLAVERLLKVGIRGMNVIEEIVPRLGAPLALHLSFEMLWTMLRDLHAADRADGPVRFRFNPTSAIPAAHWPEEA